MARLVLTHSTFIKGLKPIMQKMTSSVIISTIIPGRLSTTNSIHGKMIELKITKTITSNNIESNQKNFKILARSGSQVQEIFLVSNTEKLNSIDTLLDENDNIVNAYKDDRYLLASHLKSLLVNIKSLTISVQSDEIKNSKIDKIGIVS